MPNDLNMLRQEFEGHLFLELNDSLSWSVREEEPKINVNDVSITMQQDITIVSIFNLQEVGKE